MNLDFDPNQPLYHGTTNLFSDLIVKEGIKIIQRNRGGVDFGPGFYLTSSYEQAKEWALRRVRNPVIPNGALLEMLGLTIRDFLGIKNNLKPIVLKYEINPPETWFSFKHKIYTEGSLEWQKAVWILRHAQNVPFQYKYDWVYGPVADGGLESDDFEKIKAFPNKNQMAICSHKIINQLTLTEVISCQH